MSTSKARHQPRISASSAGLRMSLEEFDRITDCDDLYYYELIHGVLVVTPLPAAAESGSNDELNHLLRSYGRHRLRIARQARLALRL